MIDRIIRPVLPAVIVCAVLTAANTLNAQPSPSAGRPDILFIAVDDLNDWVGPLGGHPQTKTPNIDRLAARGITFVNAHSPSALCNPSRTALLTGLRPSTSGVYGNGPDWRQEAVFEGIRTLPRFFRDNGYATYGGGKIFHAHTFAPGGFAGYNDQTAWDDYYPSLEQQLPEEIRPMRTPVNGNPLMTGFDWSAVVADDRAMGDGQVVAYVSRRLEAESDGPRFLAAGIFRPHLPWYVPQHWFDLHPLDEIRLPSVIENDLADVPVLGRRAEFGADRLHDWVLENDKWAEGVQGYLASISFADAMVGRLLDALDRSGRAQNTIIVLWGDHGFHLGEKGRWRKSTLWERSTHVPLIVVAPGVSNPGDRSARPVSLMDIYPTLAELAGLEVPEYVEGRSLVPLLRDPDSQWDTPAVTTYGFDNHAVRSEKFRYIRYADGTEELYDSLEDPNEWHNLADEPQYRRVKRELARWLPEENAPALGR
ncbi:MAG: sulfatase [Gammaproteobacteria bacterium]|jgi:arylsulfatase A-like enzyme